MTTSYSTFMGKQTAKKIVIDGITFPSKLEAARYVTLTSLVEEEVISDLRLQVKFMLQESFAYKDQKIRAMSYTADFVYTYDGKQYVEDTKAQFYQDDVYRLKKKLLLYLLKDTDYFFYEIYDPTIHPSLLGSKEAGPTKKKSTPGRKSTAPDGTPGGVTKKPHSKRKRKLRASGPTQD